jgi:hypothetical protein
MIQLTKEQLEELKKFINTIPTMYGVPLLNFFGQLEQEQLKPETSENSGVNGTFGTSGTK